MYIGRYKKYIKFIYPQGSTNDVRVLDMAGECVEFFMSLNCDGKLIGRNDAIVCKEGISTNKYNILDKLKAFKDNTFDVVAIFQDKGYVDYLNMLQIFKEVKRILTIDGFFIFETIDVKKSNIFEHIHYRELVKGNISYELAIIAMKYTGFMDGIMLELDSCGDISYKYDLNRFNVINCVSASYSMVVQKNNQHEACIDLENILVELLQRYFLNNENRLNILKNNLYKLKREHKELNWHYRELLKDRDMIRREINEISTSKSWRITKPLREFTAIIKKILGKDGSQEAPKEAVQEPQATTQDRKSTRLNPVTFSSRMPSSA